jgi:hypothetical protein
MVILIEESTSTNREATIAPAGVAAEVEMGNRRSVGTLDRP